MPLLIMMHHYGHVTGATAFDAGSATVTIGPNDDVTCTITNDDKAPSLTLDKIIINDNGGQASESSFTLTATGSGTDPLVLSGSGAAGSTERSK